MNRTLRWILGIIGILFITACLLVAGFFIGRASWGIAGFWPGSRLRTFSAPQPGVVPAPFGFRIGPGMMRQFAQPDQGDLPYGYGFHMGPGMMGRGGFGMMGRWDWDVPDGVEPLSVDQARQAVEKYLADLGDSDLELHEIMIFDNHAYGEIVEKSSGIGAMEVLIDPVTLAVYPEHGPNMMWNLKYGHMGGFGGYGPGMMGGMMRRFSYPQGDLTPAEVSAEMPVTPEQAIEAAQKYLETYDPGVGVEDHTDAFYGYYTLHTLRNGKTVGMLSVNGFSSQVFPHVWHGEFIEMWEEE